jgi:hypothetical protein
MALLRNITRGLGAIPREREPGLFNLPFRPPSIQQLPPVNIGGPPIDISQIPIRAPIDPKLIDYGFGPGIMPPLPDDFGIPINPIAPPPVNIGGPPLDTSLIPEREILERPIIPPRRDDFMSIERIEDNRTNEQLRPQGIKPIPDFKATKDRGELIGGIDRIGNYGLNRQNLGMIATPAPTPDPGDGTLGDLPPGFNMDRQPSVGGGGDIGRPRVLAQPAPVTPDPVATPGPVTPPAPTTSPTAPTTDTINQGTNMATTQSQQPFASNVVRSETGLDATTKQLLFGLDGKGGFIPGAMRAAERTFFDEQGNPIVIPEQVAGLSPDQLRAQELARMGVGIQDPYLQEAGQAYRGGIDALDQGLLGARMRGEQALDATRLGVEEEQLLRDRGLARTLGGLDRAEGIATGATDQFGRRLADVERLGAGAAGRFGTRLGGIERSAAGDVGAYGGALGESEALLRDTLGGYDPSMTQQFMDPYEQAVVDQTSKDIFEQFAKSDIGARASDIARGGQSAFGSRARLGAGERTEALGRGLAEALSGIRSRGFQQAQQTGLGEFARQQAARRAASSGLGSIAGSRLGAQRGLTDLMTSGAQQRLASEQGVVDLLGRTGQQQLGAQTGLGSTIAGYGTTAGSALGGAGQAALGSAGQLAGAFGNLSGLESQIGQQRQAARFGLGAGMQGLGSQAQGARAGDVSQLYGLGQGQQQLTQAQLDAARRNALTAQQAPLAQYQALAPFVSMAPAGQFQTQTTFAPSPSPLQAGLATGLGAFGAIGNFMNQGKG